MGRGFFIVAQPLNLLEGIKHFVFAAWGGMLRHGMCHAVAELLDSTSTWLLSPDYNSSSNF